MAQVAFDFLHSQRESLFEEIVSSLQSLPELHRRVFIKSHYQGKAPETIAQELRIPLASASKLLQDANAIFYHNLHQFRV